MNVLKTPMKCCRCRNLHTEADRVHVPSKRFANATESTCPRCGSKSFYDMTPQVAWCWASGLIEIGERLPDGGPIEIARGPEYALKGQISVYARHGQGESTGKLLVPGIPESEDQNIALHALEQWLDWINKHRPRDGVVFSKGSK
jgi:predicted nucleic-acid-binding Zn-ribbon protein